MDRLAMTRFVGLTGGIGSGKSTVASMFADLAVPVLDLDQVGHILLDTEPTLAVQLAEVFGEAVLGADAKVDRQHLAQIAFKTAEHTQKLNQVMHPLIQAYELNWRQQQHAELAIIEASVLIEAQAVARMQALIVVFADETLRKQRVLSRGKQDATRFTQIVARQCSDAQRQQYCDYRLHNNAHLPALHAQVQALYATLAGDTDS
ncbi:MAG: dephospho-CoA kinase [Mariprofundaceae bacterium]|nr:dephospho-CoA kinase [Mariprofundaceae bacterium]